MFQNLTRYRKSTAFRNEVTVTVTEYMYTCRDKFRCAVKGISQRLLGHEMMLVNSVEASTPFSTQQIFLFLQGTEKTKC
jgi:hypothetical protein